VNEASWIDKSEWNVISDYNNINGDFLITASIQLKGLWDVTGATAALCFPAQSTNHYPPPLSHHCLFLQQVGNALM